MPRGIRHRPDQQSGGRDSDLVFRWSSDCDERSRAVCRVHQRRQHRGVAVDEAEDVYKMVLAQREDGVRPAPLVGHFVVSAADAVQLVRRLEAEDVDDGLPLEDAGVDVEGITEEVELPDTAIGHRHRRAEMPRTHGLGLNDRRDLLGGEGTIAVNADGDGGEQRRERQTEQRRQNAHETVEQAAALPGPDGQGHERRAYSRGYQGGTGEHRHSGTSYQTPGPRRIQYGEGPRFVRPGRYR